MVIVGAIISLLLPAVQSARESARVTSCGGNLKQVALATANFEARRGHFPSSWKATLPVPNSSSINGWSAQAQILPHLEQMQLEAQIDFEQSYTLAADVVTADGATTKLSAMRVPTYLCPSEPRDEVRLSGGEPEHYPLNYAVNLGVWHVWSPEDGQGGPGAFYPNSRVKAAQVEDGLSFTICAAEVKAYNPYYRNAAWPGPLAIPMPDEVAGLGGQFKTSSGHTEWVDGRAHQIGFTTTFRPNQRVLADVSGTTYDVDWTNQQEGKSTTAPTYAAVTARSHHGGGVNVAMLDGSTRWFTDEINLGVWRAYSTRAGQELIPSDEQ